MAPSPGEPGLLLTWGVTLWIFTYHILRNSTQFDVDGPFIDQGSWTLPIYDLHQHHNNTHGYDSLALNEHQQQSLFSILMSQILPKILLHHCMRSLIDRAGFIVSTFLGIVALQDDGHLALIPRGIGIYYALSSLFECDLADIDIHRSTTCLAIGHVIWWHSYIFEGFEQLLRIVMIIAVISTAMWACCSGTVSKEVATALICATLLQLQNVWMLQSFLGILFAAISIQYGPLSQAGCIGLAGVVYGVASYDRYQQIFETTSPIKFLCFAAFFIIASVQFKMSSTTTEVSLSVIFLTVNHSIWQLFLLSDIALLAAGSWHLWLKS